VSIHRLAKVILLAPAIGSVLIGVLGLLIGVALIVGHRSENRMLAAATQPPTPSGGNLLVNSGPRSEDSTKLAVANAELANRAQHPITSPSLRAREMRLKPAGRRGKPTYVREAIFKNPIAGTQLGFLSERAGQPANELVREHPLHYLVNEVVPYAPFHLGLDMPLPNAIESMFLTSTLPLEIRDGRYALLTGIRGSNARGRTFLWIDMKEGIGLGGIFFYPSNGEPTPTLTIFSRQVDRDSLRSMSQLPAAFVQDLSRWAAMEGVPPVTTRYFINASSEKTVLAHDEDYCRKPTDGSAPPKDVCQKMNEDARDLDRKAVSFLSQTHNASNATMHMVANASDVDGQVAR
jgi:hypothetical protein